MTQAEEKKNKEFILFYEAKEKPYGVFSNYSLSPITINKKLYDSVEHFYQSSKYENEYSEVIRKASTPNKARILARQELCFQYKWQLELNEIIKLNQAKGITLKSMRPDWEERKDEIMYQGLQAKFTQHPSLKSLLVNTGDKILVENSPRDSYWGWGKNQKGENKLGLLLMKLREEFTNSTTTKRKREEEEEEEEQEKTKSKIL